MTTSKKRKENNRKKANPAKIKDRFRQQRINAVNSGEEPAIIHETEPERWRD